MKGEGEGEKAETDSGQRESADYSERRLFISVLSSLYATCRPVCLV